MMPVGPLMTEHRLIERMMTRMRVEGERLEDASELDPFFIDAAVDFFKNYADRCHHGKEEDILFRALAEKPLSDEHRQTMNTLVEQHVFGRGLVARLLVDKKRCLDGDGKAVRDVASVLRTLTDFYPKHIETEDKHFFLPVMGYLSAAEQEEMLNRFAEFDRKLVHERYRQMLEDIKA